MNTDIQPVLVLDPIVDVEESYRASEVVKKGGVNRSMYLYTADSASDQNIIFNNITPPSLNTITRRSLVVKYSILVMTSHSTASAGDKVNINAVDSAGAPVANTLGYVQVVPRACPLQNCASSIELRLNGSATSTSANDYISIYPHLLSDEDKRRFSNFMPLQKDDSATYAPVNVIATATAQQSNRSPFNNYTANPYETARGGYVWEQVDTGTSGTLTYFIYKLTLEEELFISPMVWGKMANECAGLTNLNNLILNIRLGDVTRAISVGGLVGTGTIAGVSLTTLTRPGGAAKSAGTPSLQIQYITPDPILAAKAPSTTAMDFSLIQPFITSVGNVNNATGAVPDFTLQSLRLASIPSKLYIYACPSKNGRTNATPDTFLNITNLSLTFNNRINLFATYSELDLYSMSVKNGLKDSWVDWKYKTGSVVIIDVAEDICLDSDETDGQSNKFSTLQVKLGYSSSPIAYAGLSANVSYDFYVLVEQPGKCFINSSECQYALTGPSASQVLKLTSELDAKVSKSDIAGGAVGGGMMSDVGKLLKSGVQKFKDLNPETVSRGVEMAQSALKSLGMGVGGAVGGKVKHSRVY